MAAFHALPVGLLDDLDGVLQVNGASLLESFGITEFPVGRNRFLLLQATPANAEYINTHGLTVCVRFGR